jgi:TPR repeat protein
MRSVFAISMLAWAYTSAYAQNCVLTGQGNGGFNQRVYACDDGYGNITLEDGSGRPIQTQSQSSAAPQVYADPFGSAAQGARAGMDDAVKREQAARSFQQQDLDYERKVQQLRALQQQQLQPRESQHLQQQQQLQDIAEANKREQDAITQQWRQILATTPDVVKGIRAGAKKGDAFSQLNLGQYYEFGANVPKDDVQAVAWFKKCSGELYMCGLELGRAYSQGAGVGKDMVLSYAWYDVISAIQGDNSDVSRLRDDAYRRREAVGVLMTRDELAEAQRIATKWRPGAAMERER